MTLLENHIQDLENEHVKVNLYGFEVNCHGLLAIINRWGNDSNLSSIVGGVDENNVNKCLCR